MAKEELKTMKVSELIKVLQEYKKELGDIPVFHQTDPEGNGFGTINVDSISWTEGTNVGKAMFIFPYNENIEDELFSY